ncbi:ParB/RepB/Spo0J family partition protein [Rhodococcoides fascians]|uniref:ParB/RepB/Spo0J family partition protein n=1 Tax=Rhodococcoides fascians TaxID=1828 RepID=UPI00068E1FEB|nr:ParB/RepB/Spo0J family partition protein [Rhodococcus fascians]
MTTTTDATDAPETGATPQFELLKPSAIAPHKKNPRKALGDLGELADSMKGGAGVIEPLIVTPAKAAGKYTLIAGHRRHAAAKKAGLKLVPCIVRFDLEGDDRAQLEVMLTENLHRSDLNAIEEGTAYQTLLEFDGVDVKTLAARTGHKQATIRGRVKLASAPEPLQQKLIAKQVSIEDALALTEFADDQTVYDRIALHLGSPNFAHALESARADRKWERDEKKIAGGLGVMGARVVADYDELADEEDAADNAFEWVEIEDETDIPEGAERAAFTNRHAEGGYQLFYKQAVEKDETGAPVKPTPEPKQETPEEAAAREAKAADAKLTDDLAIAAIVRRRHLASVAAEHDEDLALKCLRLQMMDYVDRFNSPYYGSAMAELLGMPPTTNDKDEIDLDVVERHVNKMSLEQLAVNVYLVDHANEDNHLKTLHMWRRTDPYDDLLAYQNELTTLFGYEWSDVEARLLEERDKAIAAEQAADDGESE